MAATPRNNRFSGFDRLWREEDGKWKARGYSILSGNARAGDVVIFAYKTSQNPEWMMFGFTMPGEVPMVLNAEMHKDMEGISLHGAPWPRRMLGEWSENVAMFSAPPPEALVSAWMLDAEKNYIQRVSLGADFEGGDMDAISLEDIAKGQSRAAPLPKQSLTPSKGETHQTQPRQTAIARH